MRRLSLSAVLLAGCGLFESPEALQHGPAPVVAGPVGVDAAAQERARSAATEVATAAAAGGTATDCQAAVAGAVQALGGKGGVKAGGVGAGMPGAEAAPLWAQAWIAEHPAGAADALDEVVETPEGRFAHVLRPIAGVDGCGAIWVEAPVATGE